MTAPRPSCPTRTSRAPRPVEQACEPVAHSLAALFRRAIWHPRRQRIIYRPVPVLTLDPLERRVLLAGLPVYGPIYAPPPAAIVASLVTPKSAGAPLVTINQTPAERDHVRVRLGELGYLPNPASASPVQIDEALKLFRASVNRATDTRPGGFLPEVSLLAQEWFNSPAAPTWQPYAGAIGSPTLNYATSWLRSALAGVFASPTPLTLDSLSSQAGVGTNPGHAVGLAQAAGTEATFSLNGATDAQTRDFILSLQTAAQAIDPSIRVKLVVLNGPGAIAAVNAVAALQNEDGVDVAQPTDPAGGGVVAAGKLFVQLQPPRVGNEVADDEGNQLQSILTTFEQFGNKLIGRAAEFVQAKVGALNPLAAGAVTAAAGQFSGIPFVSDKIDQLVNLGNTFKKVAGKLLSPAEVRGVGPATFPSIAAQVVLQIDSDDPVSIDVPAAANAAALVAGANAALAASALNGKVEAFVDAGTVGFRTTDPDGSAGLKKTLNLSTPRVEAVADAPQYGQLAGDLTFTLALATRDRYGSGGLINNAPISITLPRTVAGGFGTDDNIQVSDLAADLNAALLGKTLAADQPDFQEIGLLNAALRFTSDGNRLRLEATNELIGQVTIAGAAAIGFGPTRTAIDTAEPARTSLGLLPGKGVAGPKFDDVPTLMAALAGSLGVAEFGGGPRDLNWSYDPATKGVTFNLNLADAFAAGVPLDFTDGLDLGGSRLEVSGRADANLSANVTTDLRLGINLGAFSATLPNFGPATPLSALNGGKGVPILTGVVAAAVPPGDATLLIDTALTIDTDGGPAAGGQSYSYNLTALSTAQNTGRAQLVGQLNAAFAADGGRFVAVLDRSPDRRIAVYSARAGIGSISITGAAGLGFADGQSDAGAPASGFADLVIALDTTPADNSPDAVYTVTLSGAKTLGDVRDKVAAQTAGGVSVEFDAAASRLRLVATNPAAQLTVLPGHYNDDPATTGPDQVEGVDSPAGLSLGVLGQATGAISGGGVTGKNLLDRVFIAAPVGGSPGLSLKLGLSAAPGAIQLGGSVGLVGLTVTNPAAFNYDLNASLTLVDPGVGAAADGQIFLSELIDAPSAAAVFTPSAALAADLNGALALTGRVGPTLGGELGRVTFSLTDPANPLSVKVTPQLALAGLLDQLKNFSVADLIGAVRGFLDKLQTDGSKYLNTDLPLTDKNLGDLVDAGQFVLDTLDTISGLKLDATTLQGLANDLRSAVANLPITADQRQPLLDLVTEFSAAAAEADPLRLGARLLAVENELRLALPTVPLPASDVQAGELASVVDRIGLNLPAFDLPALSAKLTAALNAAWPRGGNPFAANFDLVDADPATAGMQYAVVGKLAAAYELDPIAFSPDLPTGSFGPVSLVGGGSFNLRVGAELVVGFGERLDGGGGVPFLITSDPTGAGRTSRLDVTAGFTGTFNGGVQFGAVEANLLTAAADAGLTRARTATNLPVAGGAVALPEAVLGNEPNFLFAYSGGTLIDPARYTLAGTTLTFVGPAPASVDVVYRPASATSVDAPTDRASVKLTLAQPPTLPLGGAPLADAVSGGVAAAVNGIATAAAGVTFLGTTVPNAVVAAADLNNLLANGTGALRADVDTAALSSLFTDLDFDFTAIVKGIDQFLDVLGNALESGVLEKLPIVGGAVDVSGTFIGTLRDRITMPLLALLSTQAGGSFEQVAGVVRNFLYQQLGAPGANILARQMGGAGIASPSDIVVTLTADDFEIGLRIAGRDVVAGVDFTSGLGGFPIKAAGGLAVQVGYDVYLGFGLDRLSGPYLTADPRGDAEVELDLVAGLAVDTGGATPVPTAFNLNLFGLTFTATDNNEGATPGTGIFGGVSFDIKPAALTNGRLPIASLGGGFFNAFSVAATLDARLNLALNLGVSSDFPSIAADLVGGFGIAVGFAGGSPTFSVGQDPSIGFRDVRLELGDFISNVLGKPVKFVADILKPVEPLIKILRTEVPGVSQISQLAGRGKVTVLDLALQNVPEAAAAAKQFLNVATLVLQVASYIGDDVGELSLHFGDYGFGPLFGNAGMDPRIAGIAQTAAGSIRTGGLGGYFDAAQQVLDSGNAAVGDLLSTLGADPTSDGADGGLGIKLDFLEPSNIFRFLLGDTVDIIRWDIPRLELGFEYGASFPIWPVPPITLDLGLDFGAFIDLAVGFDTRGVKTGQFLDGFYFSDLDLRTMEDINEFGLQLGASLGAGVGVPGLKAGVRGKLTGEVGFNLHDTDKDGKLYLDEIAGIVRNDGIGCLFDISATIKVALGVYWQVLFFSGSADLLTATLLDISNAGACPTAVPATLVQNTGDLTFNGAPVQAGTLVIHTGQFASLRGGGASDTSESATVTEVAPGVYQAKVLGITAGFTGVQRILFDGGAGNDGLFLVDGLGGGFNVPVMAFGGEGNDTLNGSTSADTLVGGTGNDSLAGGEGDNSLDGGDGNDTLTAGAGNDALTGGEGADSIAAGEGNNAIVAGGGSDTVTAGGGADTVDGGAGDDLITTGAGDDSVDLGAGNDTLDSGEGNDSVLGGAGRDLIATGPGNDLIDAGGDRDTITSGVGNDTIRGGGGSDRIDAGEGDDSILGEAGNDAIRAGDGNDYVDGGLGNDFVVGQAGRDTILGNWGSDVLIANEVALPNSDFGERIEGGPGDDFICGGSKDDTILGGSSDLYLAPVVAVGTFTNGVLTAADIPGGFTAVDCDTLPTPITVDPASVAVSVGLDANRNGTFDTGEGVGGVTVRLLDAAGLPVAETQTDAGGRASFADVEQGSYQIAQIVPPGLSQLRPGAGETVPLDLPEGGSGSAAFLDGSSAQITGVKFVDADRDGNLDPGETRLPGVTITAAPATPGGSGGPTYTAVTDAEGRYTFADVAPGDYTVTEVPQAGFVQTFPRPAQQTYFQDFNAAAPAEFTPAPQVNGTLGTFGNETVTGDLPVAAPHSAVTVEFDLYIIGGWGGTEENAAPFGTDGDFFNVQVLGSTPLSQTFTFSNLSLGGATRFGQSYPAEAGSGAVNPAGAGAAAMNTLGLTAGSDALPDARYHLSFTVPHDSPILRLELAGSGLEGAVNLGGADGTVNLPETWAIDNVRVTTLGRAHRVTAAPGQTAGDFNFGNARPGGEVVGQVRRDDDGGGTFNAADFPLNGRPVALVDPARISATNDGVIARATTGNLDLNGDGFIDPYTERGRYRFVGVAPGTYFVDANQRRTVTVVDGGTGVANFLELTDTSDATGLVFADRNRNGLHDGPSEPGLAAKVFIDAPSDGQAVGDGVAGTYARTFAYAGSQNFRPDLTLVDVVGVVGQSAGLTVGVDLTLRPTATGPVGAKAVLISPTGATAGLFDLTLDPAKAGRFNVTFDDAAAAALPDDGDANHDGTFRPSGSLAALVGGDPTGQWKIAFAFTDPSAVTINRWALSLTLAEPTQNTAAGQYDFAGVPAGLFRVAQVPLAGLSLTRPGAGDGTYLLRTRPGEDFADLDFGNAAPLVRGTIVGASIVYNNSKFDGNDPALNAADLDAVALDKKSLLPGQTATFENVSGYARGINEIAVDVLNRARNLTPKGFRYRVGNVSDTSTWVNAPFPNNFITLPGAGVGGSDRFLISWPDRAIKGEWLEVTVDADLSGGVGGIGGTFYFGSAPGDTGLGNTAEHFLVGPPDEVGVRGNTRGIFTPAPITFAYDLNRDKLVGPSDGTVVRTNATDPASALRVITPTGPALLAASTKTPAPAASAAGVPAPIGITGGSDGEGFGPATVVVDNVKAGPITRTPVAVPRVPITRSPVAVSRPALISPVAVAKAVAPSLFPPPQQIAIDYRTGLLSQISLTNGALSNFRQAVPTVIGITRAPTDAADAGPRLVGIDLDGHLVDIDPATGQTRLGPAVFLSDLDAGGIARLVFEEGDLDFVPATDPYRPGQLIAALELEIRIPNSDIRPARSWNLFQIDRDTGAATFLAPVSYAINGQTVGASNVSALAFDGAGAGWLLANNGLLKVDLQPAVPVVTGPFAFNNLAAAFNFNFAGADFSQADGLLYVAIDNSLVSIDVRPGANFAVKSVGIRNGGAISGLELYDQTFAFKDGRDTIDGQAGDDLILGDHQISDPHLIPDGSADLIYGGVGSDQIDGQFEDDRLIGGPSRPQLAPAVGEGNDTLRGGAGTDRLELEVDANVTLTDGLVTGQGSDTLIGVETAILTGGAGNNLLDASAFTLGSVTLLGGAGDDTLRGGSGDDSLAGQAGNDSLAGGAGSDFYRFDTPVGVENETIDDTAAIGRDAVDFSGVNAGLTIDLSSPGFVSGATLNIAATPGTLIEDVVGTRFEDRITGNAQDNRIDAGAGSDTIAGGAGSDTYLFRVETAPQNDVVIELPGGGARDLLDFRSLVAGQNLAARLDDPANLAAYAGSTVSAAPGSAEFEDVFGGAGDDLYVDNARDNRFAGNAGDDRYVFNPATGAPVVDAVLELPGGGNDTLDLSRAAAGYVVDLTAPAGALALAGPHTIAGLAGTVENVVGSSGADSITGTNGPNVIDAGPGNDTISAGAGADTITPGLGDDVVDGGIGPDLYLFVDPTIAETDTLRDPGGQDALDFSALSTGVVADLDPARATTTLVSGGLLTVLDPDKATWEMLTGTAFDDSLRGGPAANTLIGQAGNDTIEGGAGSDVLDGGEGDDTYVFAAAPGPELDVIRDELVGSNKLDFSGSTAAQVIDLSKPGIGLIAQGGGRSVFGTGADFTDAVGGFGADSIVGNDRPNVLAALAGDRVSGGRGADTLVLLGSATAIGGAGDDAYVLTPGGSYRLVEAPGSVVGGTGIARDGGFDTIDLGAFTDTVNFSLDTPTQTIDGGATTIRLAAPGGFFGTTPNAQNFEGVIGSRTAPNQLAGNSAANLLVGGPLNDTLFSIDANDTLVGEAGDDMLFGFAGGNVLLGGAGADTLAAGPGRDVEIGGAGADFFGENLIVSPDADEDILIDGTTDYDGAPNAIETAADLRRPEVIAARRALSQIAAAWIRADQPFDQRRATIAAGLGADGVGFNGTTVRSDGDADTLNGQGGRDWFFRGPEDADDSTAEDFVQAV